MTGPVSVAGSLLLRMRRWVPRVGIGASVALASLFAGFFASVAGPPRAAAQPAAAVDPKAIALFKEARALMEKGLYAEACPKLEESLRIDAGMGTLYNLSDCYAHIGRTASAWTGFRDVAAAADAAGQGPRAQAARERAAALEPSLSKLRISVSTGAAAVGVEVQRNGVVVGRLLWGTDVPVDPGTYVISASAPGRQPWSVTVPVEGTGKLATVEVPPLAPLKQEAPIMAVDPPPRPTSSGERSALPVVLLGGLAAAGVGGGVALLVLSSSEQEAALRLHGEIPENIPGQDNACLVRPAPAACDELESTATRAATFRALSIGGFVLGGVGVAGMAIVLLLPPPSGSSGGPGSATQARSFYVLPTVDGASRGAGLLVGGSF